MILKYWYPFLLVISVFVISIALIAEYIFNLQPCELCLKQRHPYYLFVIISITILYLPLFNNIVFYSIIQLGAIYGIFYSFWHIGVENKFFKGPGGCSSDLSISENINDLKEQILSKKVVSCDEVIWSIFGISAASFNLLVLIFIFIINGLYIYYNGKKEKKI